MGCMFGVSVIIGDILIYDYTVLEFKLCFVKNVETNYQMIQYSVRNAGQDQVYRELINQE